MSNTPQPAANARSSAPDPVRLARIRFDPIDIAILSQLQAHSKITNAELASRVGLSPTAALDRVRKLEKAGVISGYVALLDARAVGKGLTAFVNVRTKDHGQEGVEAFKAAVHGFDEVQGVWHTTGDDDFLLKVVVTDMEQYERFAVHVLATLPNVGHVQTRFSLRTVKDTTAVPLDAVDTAGL